MLLIYAICALLVTYNHTKSNAVVKSSYYITINTATFITHLVKKINLFDKTPLP